MSSEFECYLGVRQGESLSPFLFSIYLNNSENEFYNSRINRIDIGNCFFYCTQMI